MGTGLFYQLRANRHKKRYTQPQSYHVRMSVEFPAKSSTGFILLPTPLSTAYQTVTQSNESKQGPFTDNFPDHAQFITTPYADYWQIPVTAPITAEMIPPATIELNYEVQVQPRVPSLADIRSANLTDYSTAPEITQWLKPATHLHIEDPHIQQLIHNELPPQISVLKTVAATYQYVMKHLTYGNPIRGLYRSDTALKETCVDCGGFDSVLVTLLRASGVPARIVAGYWAGYPHNDMHAWVECLLPNMLPNKEQTPHEWIPLDPSVHQLRNQNRSTKSGGFGWVGSDRIAVSVDCDHAISLSHDNHIELDIMQTPIFIPTGKKTGKQISSNSISSDSVLPLPYQLTTRTI